MKEQGSCDLMTVGTFKLSSSWPPAAARCAGDCRGGATNTAMKSDTLCVTGTERADKSGSYRNTSVQPVLSACKTQQLATSLSSPQVGWQNWAIYWWHHYHIIVTVYIVFFKCTYIALMPCTFYLFFLLYLCCVNNQMRLKFSSLCNDNKRILILILIFPGCCVTWRMLYVYSCWLSHRCGCTDATHLKVCDVWVEHTSYTPTHSSLSRCQLVIWPSAASDSILSWVSWWSHDCNAFWAFCRDSPSCSHCCFWRMWGGEKERR